MCFLLQQLLGGLDDQFPALSSKSGAVGKICRVVRRNLPKLCVDCS